MLAPEEVKLVKRTIAKSNSEINDAIIHTKK